MTKSEVVNVEDVIGVSKETVMLIGEAYTLSPERTTSPFTLQENTGFAAIPL